MLDPLNLAMLVVALFSAIFVAIAGGIKLTIGYRGSEETRKRKKRIDDKLNTEIIKKINSFMESDDCKRDNPKRIDVISDLGYECYIAKNLTQDILDNSTYYMKNTLKQLISAIGLIFLIFMAYLYLDLSQSFNSVVFYAYVGGSLYLFYIAIKSISKAMSLRTNFIELDEKPTIEHATELHEDLVDNDIL